MANALMSRMDRILVETLNSGGTYHTVAGGYSMTPRDHLLHVQCDDTIGGTIYLPSVVEAAGQLYIIKGISGTDTITITDQGDDLIGFTDTMNAAAEVMVMFSDGEQWYQLLGLNL